MTSRDRNSAIVRYSIAWIAYGGATIGVPKERSSMEKKNSDDSTKQVPIQDLKMEPGVEDLLNSPAMQPYMNLGRRGVPGRGTGRS